MNLDKNNKGFSIVGLIVIIIIFASAGIIWFYFETKTNQNISKNITQSQTPSAKITDLAPGIPNSQKTAILVMHSDSSYEKFLLHTANVSNFIKSLPEGDRVISQSALGQ